MTFPLEETMTFEEWDQANYPAPTEVNWITNGIERGNRHAGWEAGQEAMREECAKVAEHTAIARCMRHQKTQSGVCGHEIAAAIRALPVE